MWFFIVYKILTTYSWSLITYKGSNSFTLISDILNIKLYISISFTSILFASKFFRCQTVLSLVNPNILTDEYFVFISYILIVTVGIGFLEWIQ